MTQTDPLMARAREIAAKLHPETLPVFLSSLTVRDEEGISQNVIAIIRDALNEERTRALHEAASRDLRARAQD